MGVTLEMVGQLRLLVVAALMDELFIACTLGTLAALATRLRRACALLRWPGQRDLHKHNRKKNTRTRVNIVFMMDPEHSDDGGAKSSIKIMFTRVRHGERQYQSSGMA